MKDNSVKEEAPHQPHTSKISKDSLVEADLMRVLDERFPKFDKEVARLLIEWSSAISRHADGLWLTARHDFLSRMVNELVTAQQAIGYQRGRDDAAEVGREYGALSAKAFYDKYGTDSIEQAIRSLSLLEKSEENPV